MLMRFSISTVSSQALPDTMKLCQHQSARSGTDMTASKKSCFCVALHDRVDCTKVQKQVEMMDNVELV